MSSGSTMTNVYLCINNYELINEMIQKGTTNHRFNIVGIATSIIKDPMIFLSVKADIIILQYDMEMNKCFELLSEMVHQEAYQSLKIILLAKKIDLNAVQLLLQFDILEYIMEPYSTQDIMGKIISEGKNRVQRDDKIKNIDALTTRIMMDIGLPLHLLGFQFIKDSAVIVSTYRVGRRLIIKDIFHEVAKQNHTLSSRVEKNVRTTINYAFRTQPDKICIYREKPTSSQIIAYIAQQIKLLLDGRQ